MTVTATGPRTPSYDDGGRYVHEAFLYADEASYLAGTVPFVQAAVEAGEPVLVMVPGPKLDLIRDAVGSGTDRVLFADMTEVGSNPARIIPAWVGFLDSYAGRPVRGIGEPIWAGRRPAELVECQFHEALLNRAVDPATPFRLRCPYDTTALPPAVLREAQLSHPVIAGPDPAPSRDYDDDPDIFLGAPLPEPTARVELLVFGEGNLTDVRELVGRSAADVGLDRSTAAALTLCVHEVATNSVRHGGGVGRLRTWQDADALVFEVRDEGVLSDPLAGRLPPPPERESGRGLWLAHHLCDLVQVR